MQMNYNEREENGFYIEAEWNNYNEQTQGFLSAGFCRVSDPAPLISDPAPKNETRHV